jgi:oligo-1,6-glucosidase
MRVPSAKLFETMILTLRGTPFLFQGDELGMTDFPFKTLADYDDIAVKNAYKALVDTGKVSAQAFLASQAKVARDNARTPIQWDSSPEAGFTTSTHPWLAVNPNYKQINAAQEESDPASVLNYVRALIALRAHTLAFVYGDFEDLDPQHPHVFAYTRTLGAEKYLVVENFSSQTTSRRANSSWRIFPHRTRPTPTRSISLRGSHAFTSNSEVKGSLNTLL